MKLIAALRNYTLARISERKGSVLVVHEATELDYTTLHSLSDQLGQIGKGTHRGYICQNVIAIDADTGEALGLLDQVLHCRDEVPEHETLTESRARETRAEPAGTRAFHDGCPSSERPRGPQASRIRGTGRANPVAATPCEIRS